MASLAAAELPIVYSKIGGARYSFALTLPARSMQRPRPRSVACGVYSRSPEWGSGSKRSGAGLRLRFDADGTVGRHGGPWTALLGRPFVALADDLLATQERHDLVPGERLVFEQSVGKLVQIVGVVGQNLAAPGLGAVDDLANFFVDDLRRRLGNGLMLRHRVAKEDLFLVLGVTQRPELVAHAPDGDHLARHLRRLRDVVGGARGDLLVPEDQVFGDAPPHRNDEMRLELVARHGILILFRQAHQHAEGPTAWNAGRLVDLIGTGRVPGSDRVPRPVIGGEALPPVGLVAREN